MTRPLRCIACMAAAHCIAFAASPSAAGPPTGPQLQDPMSGTLELVTPSAAAQAQLDLIDGLTFDAFGNLIGVREVTGVGGGVVFIDKATGAVVTLVSGISRADQIALHPSGDLYVTSEVTPALTTSRLFRIQINYGSGQTPLAAGTMSTSVTTTLAIDNPEGLVALDANGAYGNAGDLYVAEDKAPGDIFRVVPGTGTATVLATSLLRPEGLAFGDFGGAQTPALYTAETLRGQVSEIDTNGVATKLGNPAAVSLTAPDNVEFGPDGFLYVTEDRPAPDSRIIRVASDGTHSVFATGFGQAAGLIFDPSNGDLYIAEQDLDRVWRVVFAPEPAAAPLATAALVVLGALRRLRTRHPQTTRDGAC